jgi:hypothetical protein
LDPRIKGQYYPGEAFALLNPRTPLTFQTERAHHKIYGEARSVGPMGLIGEDGESPFEGVIHFYMEGIDEEALGPDSPSGVVILDSADALSLSVYLSDTMVERICRELIARPDALLSVSLRFGYYRYYCPIGGFYGRNLLERDTETPIIEAHVQVVDRPLDWADNDKAIEPPREAAPEAPVVVHPPDFSPLVMRLNWAVGLLVLLVLVMLFK